MFTIKFFIIIGHAMVCFSYLSSKRNRKTNIWFKLNQFVAGTSLKESKKNVSTNHSARKTTVSKLKKAKIVSSDYIASVTGHGGINFLNDYDEADEDERRLLSLAIGQGQMK